MNIEEKLNYCLNCKTKPCTKGCPLENDIPEIIKLMKKEKYHEAYDALTLTNVLPSICGRICPYNKQCEGKCTRKITGLPVDIGKIEKELGDLALENNYEMKKFDDYEDNKKKNINVAVIGAGPAGLSCAAFLARNGINVTIFEKHNEPGGLLAHGIPEFRLNTFILNSSINHILDLGVSIKYNCELGKDITLSELQNNYNAVFLGIGANISATMDIEGERLAGVYGANELLEYSKNLSYKGKNIAVIGGGNVAIDMARTAKRKGAEDVYIIYRRSEKEMPAEKNEIEEAKRDGVKFLFQNNIIKIIDHNEKAGQVTKIECIKTEPVRKEGTDREIPVNIENSNYFINVNMVIMAIGSKVEQEIIKKCNLDVNKRGYVYIDDNQMTSECNVFAGGDLVGINSTVAWAQRSGRDAGEKILKML